MSIEEPTTESFAPYGQIITNPEHVEQVGKKFKDQFVFDFSQLKFLGLA
jgi:hypothetical protein